MMSAAEMRYIMPLMINKRIIYKFKSQSQVLNLMFEHIVLISYPFPKSLIHAIQFAKIGSRYCITKVKTKRAIN